MEKTYVIARDAFDQPLKRVLVGFARNRAFIAVQPEEGAPEPTFKDAVGFPLTHVYLYDPEIHARLLRGRMPNAWDEEASQLRTLRKGRKKRSPAARDDEP